MTCPIPVMNDRAKEATKDVCVWVWDEEEKCYYTECNERIGVYYPKLPCGCGKQIRILEDV
jgi:hypothetical protein